VKFAFAPLLSAAALLGAVGGFLAYRHYATVRPMLRAVPAVAAVTTTVAPAPPTTPMPVETIPAEVPDLRLPDLAGHPRALRDGSGHPHLFNFWATWCEPCRREIPLLNTLQHAYQGDHLQVVGIAVDFHDAVRRYLKTTRLDYELLVGEDEGYEVAQKFGMELALPFSVFADERDRIIAVKVGELHREEVEAILGQMRSLRAGKITLPMARDGIDDALREISIARAKQSNANR
jgi:thiol-disulfide isomerase/thioredoxin